MGLQCIPWLVLGPTKVYKVYKDRKLSKWFTLYRKIAFFRQKETKIIFFLAFTDQIKLIFIHFLSYCVFIQICGLTLSENINFFLAIILRDQPTNLPTIYWFQMSKMNFYYRIFWLKIYIILYMLVYAVSFRVDRLIVPL